MNDIIQKVKRITEGFHIGYTDTLGNYYPANFDHFYRYFNDSDKETRRHAFFLFMYLVGNTYARHCYVFYSPKYTARSHSLYLFDRYLQAFLLHHEKLQKEFPIVYHFTVYYLSNIENRIEETYEDYYSDIPKELFSRLRRDVLEPNKRVQDMKQFPHMKYLLHEMGIEPFFKEDFL